MAPNLTLTEKKIGSKFVLELNLWLAQIFYFARKESSFQNSYMAENLMFAQKFYELKNFVGSKFIGFIKFVVGSFF